MAVAHARETDESAIPAALRRFLWNRMSELLGLAGIAAILAIGVALATWSASDPSFNHATGAKVMNRLGTPGAYLADFLMQPLGLAAAVLVFVPLAWIAPMLRHERPEALRHKALWWLAAVASASLVLSSLPRPAGWPLAAGLGGSIGDIANSAAVALLSVFIKGQIPNLVLGVVAALGFPYALPRALGFEWAAVGTALGKMKPAPRPAKKKTKVAVQPDEDDEAPAPKGPGVLARSWSLVAAVAAKLLAGKADDGAMPAAEAEPDRLGRFRPITLRQPQINYDEAEGAGEDAPALEDEAEAEEVAEADEEIEEAEAEEEAPVARKAPKAAARAPKPRSKQKFELPELDYLAEPKKAGRVPEQSKEQLEDNARQLESVLDDFGVKGQIIAVRPGPVVTLYELEPAPGVKSSRVISLADDIARSMSAISARVAVVSGRNAIGIELPNAKRETVYVREMFQGESFINNHTNLTVALGKNIGGDPVFADLAKMPHLLIAGTTGSGKSVGINTLILSLLYRLPPEKCKLIMIDPKMLELSVYEGIPHLLAPVVTDPRKAVVALKWAVREMEERYKKMSKCGVRNVDGYNTKMAQIAAKGEKATRTVQTGFDAETGEPVFEQEELDLAPMPYIVVIIDEMADLMMVAGKDIEGAVQRLAQMARAAGIHVVMATQRPSVDVITGTIKANFPTRISFQVTSKIDSRTILGEQGAEQLLGQGDMLYMAGGGRISRLHGPFVSDGEVEAVVNHLKAQGQPEYLEAVTEEIEDGGEGGALPGGGGGSGDDLYDQAVQVVLRDKKVSTSYVQRRLGVGYNKAATLIERMEQEGVISAPNGQGKREILVPGDSAR